MTTNTTFDLLREGATILRREGIVPTVRAGFRVLNLNYQGYWWYLKYLYRDRICCESQTADPFTVIYVSPNRITHRPDRSINRWNDLGAVLDGDWDKSNHSVDELIKYRSVVDHFGNGTPWEETAVYREALKRIDRGEAFWNGSLTKEAVHERIDHLENLYDSIRTDGFKSQEELEGKPLREIVLSRKFDRSKEEVAVAIGRNGEILFIDGNHRLAIASVLELNTIPVHVIARHVQWQALRDEVLEANNFNDLSPEAEKHLSHNDMPKI